MSDTLLQIKDLKTAFFTDSGVVRAVNGVSFNLEKGKVLGIVGESGSGKSVTAYSVLRILVDPGKVVGGEVLFKGEDVLKYSKRKMRSLRGDKISIIFQDPMTSLNPVYTIGNQLMETIILHTDRTREQARERALEMLTLVGVNDPAKVVAVTTPLNILSKPRAAYTDMAGLYWIEGSVLLKVTLLSNGQIGSITVLKKLPFGLTQNAIKAARSVQFEPKKVNGVPVSVTKTIEYNFNIY
jgi:TonB family protein